jgi:hypothetical protein
MSVLVLERRQPCPRCGLTICDESKHVPTPRRDRRPSDRLVVFPWVPADETPGGVVDEQRLSERLAALPPDLGPRGHSGGGDGRLVSGCTTCGWPNRLERTPADDCPLFGDPDHDSLNCSDCWGICNELCKGCGRPVRVALSGGTGRAAQ